MGSYLSSKGVLFDDEGTVLCLEPLGELEVDRMFARWCWSNRTRTSSGFYLISVVLHLDCAEGYMGTGNGVLVRFTRTCKTMTSINGVCKAFMFSSSISRQIL